MNGSFTQRRSRLCQVLGALLLAALDPPAFAEDLDIEVYAKDTKSDGLPWDGCPSAFWSVPNPFSKYTGDVMMNPAEPSPPELRLIVYRERAGQQPHPRNNCNDSERCVFQGIAYNNEVLGLLLIDEDMMGKQDFVEAVVLVPDKTGQWMRRAKDMRSWLLREAQTFKPGTFDLCRGPRPPSTIDIKPLARDECPLGSGCDLDNSYWMIDSSSASADPWDWK
jgi:hypothetical protein